MTRIDVANATVASLVAEYRASAAAQGAATETGDFEEANRFHDTVASVYRELRRRGDEARAELVRLLDDIDPHVRCWAAAHALEFAPDRGEATLKRLACGGGVVGLNAEMTLQEWKKGSLVFP